MAKGKGETIDSPIQNELEAIKRLLILLLVKAGTTQEEIAMALDVTQSAVSEMCPARKIKKFE